MLRSKKIKQKTKNKIFGRSDVKERVKTKNFSHVIAKARFHIKYLSGDKKLCSSVVSNLFHYHESRYQGK